MQPINTFELVYFELFLEIASPKQSLDHIGNVDSTENCNQYQEHRKSSEGEESCSAPSIAKVQTVVIKWNVNNPVLASKISAFKYSKRMNMAEVPVLASTLEPKKDVIIETQKHLMEQVERLPSYMFWTQIKSNVYDKADRKITSLPYLESEYNPESSTFYKSYEEFLKTEYENDQTNSTLSDEESALSSTGSTSANSTSKSSDETQIPNLAAAKTSFEDSSRIFTKLFCHRCFKYGCNEHCKLN